MIASIIKACIPSFQQYRSTVPSEKVVYFDSLEIAMMTFSPSGSYLTINNFDCYEVEEVLTSQADSLYELIQSDYLSGHNSKDQILNKNPRGMRHYDKWTRQYYSTIESNGDTIIHVNLLNASKHPKEFKYWRNEIQVGFGRFYEENTQKYRYNISSGRLEK